jgi:hypothetical protein
MNNKNDLKIDISIIDCDKNILELSNKIENTNSSDTCIITINLFDKDCEDEKIIKKRKIKKSDCT